MVLSFVDVERNCYFAQDVEKIFRVSFPRRTAIGMDDFFRMRSTGDFDFKAIFDGDDLIGFYNALISENIVYLFFFAIDPNHRSQGYGSKILSMLPNEYPGKIQVLDMERVDSAADNYSQRCRRRDFYQKNGYFDSGYQISYYDEVFTVMTKAPFSAEELGTLLNTADLKDFVPRIYPSQ